MCLNKCKGCKKKLSEQPLLNYMERQLALAVEELTERVTELEARQDIRKETNKELNKQ